MRQKFSLPDKPIAMYCGRIAEMKGIREILTTIETWDDCPYLPVLVGDVNANTDEECEGWDVTQKIRELEKAGRLRWLGFQDDRALHGLYSLADIGLMPSSHEPFGIVALEMMAAGLPLISTEVDGLGEIVTDEDSNEYSLIIGPKNPRQIRQAMQHLWGHSEACEELRALGLERLSAFTWEKAAEQTVNLYRKLVDA